MTPIIFPKVPEKGASDEEWTKYDKNLQEVITRYINDAIKKASDETTAVSDSIPGIASSAQAIAGIDNSTIISPLRMREGFNASSDAPVYACRAWVQFNGTGTVAITGSGNVSSITDSGTGLYIVNFTTALEDANYAVVVSGKRNASNSVFVGTIRYNVTPTESAVGVCGLVTSTPAIEDSQFMCVAVFR